MSRINALLAGILPDIDESGFVDVFLVFRPASWPVSLLQLINMHLRKAYHSSMKNISSKDEVLAKEHLVHKPALELCMMLLTRVGSSLLRPRRCSDNNKPPRLRRHPGQADTCVKEDLSIGSLVLGLGGRTHQDDLGMHRLNVWRHARNGPACLEVCSARGRID